MICRLAVLLTFVCLAMTCPVSADDVDPAVRNKAFSEKMTGAKFVGGFTVTGKEDAGLKEEAYSISSVQKLDEGDYWLFKARIKYGDKDVELPIPLQVKWAGDTPVIVLEKTTLPGLGTFSSRVVIDGDKYAGTWTHDDNGGHLFGKIVKEKPAQE